jgi:hypothetical protein
VHIEYQPDITLILPIDATSLQTAVTRIVPTKLSLEALQELLDVASEHEEECRSTPVTSGEACPDLSAGRSPKTSPLFSGR